MRKTTVEWKLLVHVMMFVTVIDFNSYRISIGQDYRIDPYKR